jgi:hypothetical protein
MVFRNQFWMGANLFSFSQFSCEKLKRVAPFEAVSGFSDGVTTRYCVFFLSVFSLRIYYYYHAALKKKLATYLYRTITWQRWRPPPPHPKSCRNMMRTWVTSAKRISPSNRGQCTLFLCNGHKKSTSYHTKNSPCVPERADPM